MESTTGDDNQGNRWSTSRWRDNETTTGTTPERRSLSVLGQIGLRQRIESYAWFATHSAVRLGKTAPLSVGGLVRKGRPWATKAV